MSLIKNRLAFSVEKRKADGAGREYAFCIFPGLNAMGGDATVGSLAPRNLTHTSVS
jgi:hypothetical protein